MRRAVLERDGRTCRIAGPRCVTSATEVDHIGSRDDHTLANLRAVCRACHASRTARQANAASPMRRVAPRRRTTEPHPTFS